MVVLISAHRVLRELELMDNCPFCHANKLLEVDCEVDDYGCKVFFVRCVCGGAGPHRETKERAIAGWNLRFCKISDGVEIGCPNRLEEAVIKESKRLSTYHQMRHIDNYLEHIILSSLFSAVRELERFEKANF